MNRKTALGIALGIAMVVMLGGMVLSTNWAEDTNMGDSPTDIPFSPSPGHDFKDTLNYAVFETYGPVLIVVTMLLFGAIIGAAAISKEDVEEEK